MSVRKRRALTAVSAALWVAWLSAEWVTMSADHALSAGHRVGTLALMLLAGLSAVALILAYVMVPVMATSRVLAEVIITEREQCTCDTRMVANGPAQVIPIRARHLTISDN